MNASLLLVVLLLPAAPQSSQQSPSAEPAPVGTRLLDLDGDGALDLLSLHADGALDIRRNVGPRQFLAVPQELPRVRVTEVLCSDLDGDGRPDLYLVSAGADVALLGEGGGRFRAATDELGLGESGHGLSAERRDVDADGLLDLVVHNQGSDVLFWARADGRFEREERTSDGVVSTVGIPGAVLVDAGQVVPHEAPASDRSNAGGRPSVAASPGAPAGPNGLVAAPSPTSSPAPLMAISFDARYVNDNQDEVDSADIVDGSLTGADISTVSGNVGIGTTTPSAKLDVVGNLAVDGSTLFVNSTNNRVGIGTTSPAIPLDVRAAVPVSNILPGALDGGSTLNVIGRDAVIEVVGEQVGSTSAAFGLKELDASGAHVSTWGLVRNTGVSGALKFTNGTNVSLGANPTLMTLTAAGALVVNGQIETLSGGVKFPDGSVQTKAAPGYTNSQFLTLGGGDFQVFSGAVDDCTMDHLFHDIFLPGGNGLWADTGFLVAPIHLPAGAQVLSITAHVYDTDPNKNYIVNLFRKLNTRGYVNEASFTVNAGVVGNYSQTFTGGPLINGTNSYFLTMRDLVGGGSENFAVQNVVIEWRMP